MMLRKRIWMPALGAAMCSFAAACAVAGEGSCGLDTGMWASPQQACQYAGRPEEASRRFGEEALLEWHSGFYRFQGASCAIFAANLAAKICTLDVECSYGDKHYRGNFSIERQSATQFRFGARPDSPIYSYCGPGVIRP